MHYSLVNRATYFEDLALLASQTKPGGRIAIATMDIDPNEPMIQRMLNALQKAAGRGVRVLLLVDAMNFLMDDYNIPGPLFYKPSLDALRGKYARKFQALQKIEAAGGTLFVTNIPARRFNIPQIGRSHVKGAIIDNDVFIGGCNLMRPGHLDCMARLHSRGAADTLDAWFLKMASSQTVREAFGGKDQAAKIDTASTLMFDAGVPNQSSIYDAALRLIDEAEQRLFITCQYFPGGRTAKHLAAAQARGVEVSIVYGHPRRQGVLSPLHHAHQLAERARGVPPVFFSNRLGRRAPKLHAKVLVSEKAAMIGSHNYVIQGVQFGTAELALHSTNPAFANQLRAFMQHQIATI